MKTLCILTDGFEELEAVGTLALFRRANLEIDICSLSGKEATGRFDMTFTELKNIDEIDPSAYGAIFLPGGPHYAKLEADKRAVSIIQSFFKENKIIGAICAAPTILGRLGLLEGKHYTCFTSMNEDFKGTYVDSYTATDGNLVTGRSAAASIDFAFALMEKVADKETADQVKKDIYYDVMNQK